jgi:hemoglobin/transferrin/lactoferrin receptor protein
MNGTVRGGRSVRVDTYSSRYHWKPSALNGLDFKATLWHTDTDSLNNSPNSNTPTGPNAAREHYKRWGLDLENTSRISHGGWGESQLRYGLSGQWESLDSLDGQGNETTTSRSGERDEYSAFRGWQYKPIPSLTLDAGLRYSRFESKDDRDVVPDAESDLCSDADGDGACDPIPNRNKQSGSAPVASLIWEPGLRGLQFYGRYAEAYRMPSLFESTQGFSIQAQPDIILQPEHTRSKEVGINYLHDGWLRPDDKLRLKFAYFQNKTTDYLTRTTANLWEDGVTEDNAYYQLVMRNIDSAMFNGLELSGSYDIGWAFTEFGVTKYNEIEICHRGSDRRHRCNNYGIAGSYINNMVPPNWHANLTLGTRLLQRKLTLGLRAILMGKHNTEPEYNNDVDRSFLDVVPWHAYEVFDFFARYQHSERVSVDFNLDNFTDRYYLDALSLGLIPAPGRTARLSLTLRY